MVGIALNGTDVVFESRQGEPITATLQRAGYTMRIACKRGGCGLCRIQVVSGEIAYSTTVCERVLSLEERQKGITLACRAVPVGDVTISVPNEGKLRCIAPSFTRFALRDHNRTCSDYKRGEGGDPYS